MSLFDFFKRSTASDANAPHAPKPRFDARGVNVAFSHNLPEHTVEGLLSAIREASAEEAILGVYLAQLADEGKAEIHGAGVTITWNSLYELLSSPEHIGSLEMLGLPGVGELRPVLTASATLSDANFELQVGGWAQGNRAVKIDRTNGGVIYVDGAEQLLSAAAWRTLDAIQQFSKRDKAMRTQHANELAWGHIRKLADQAGALYETPYLETTLVLTPDALRLPLSKEDTGFGRVVTVSPTFDGAPDGWLNAFDGFNSVQPHYDLTRGAGRVRIVISEPVRQVLSVIKREMPRRKVAGAKAEKFIHNPFAFLGEAAHEVLDEAQFQIDRGESGPVAAHFGLAVNSKDHRISTVDLVVTEHWADTRALTTTQTFLEHARLLEFLQALEAALLADREQFPWDEYDLTVDAESPNTLDAGRQYAHLWRVQPAQQISYNEIYEIAGYSGRIEGIGAAKPIYVPVFQVEKPAKSPDGDPSNEKRTPPGDIELPPDGALHIQVHLPNIPEPVSLPVDRTWVQRFEDAVKDAESSGADQVADSVLPTPLPTKGARSLVDQLGSLIRAQDRLKTDGHSLPKEPGKARQTLLLKTNFHAVDYEEERRSALALHEPWSARLPSSLRPSISLKQHQLYGVAWFQNLVANAPFACRGALLADDMGLGKTLQLLCVLGAYYEAQPNARPSIIFAPKSLLENWANEARKFFTDSFPNVLALYGDELTARKQPSNLIDVQLRDKGIVDLLKPQWAGNAKIIITTYEVLTSYEFSLAKEPFAFMICDEAQRIKTPGTLVTLAAKKLKADFRIACTGTPVENSLADLWCLFDLVQPGLLGALETFGKTYRRPIECKTDDQRDAIQRLQLAIAPQTLRRTKADIAADLPNKFYAHRRAGQQALHFKQTLEDEDRLEIPLTEYQRVLYLSGLKKLQDAANETNGRKRAQRSFGALHLMKAVCAEPYCLPGSKFLVDNQGPRAHLSNSPKLQWLLDRLGEVRAAGEKAIVFTELREVQAALYYFLKETFGIQPYIINGDSQNRQGYIDKFTAKPGFDVIILSTLAAGAGLNVTAANHVFHFTRAWNPSKEAQATDRAYRIGQEKDVYVYCPTVVSNAFVTFEVRLDQLLKRKAGLAGATLDDGGLTSMLNGSGKDASIVDLMNEGVDGVPIPVRNLTIDDVDRLDGHGFEVLCCLLWEQRGFVSKLTDKKGGDGGIDVLAFSGKKGELLQCKSSRSNEVGWDAVKEVTAGAALYQARYPATQFAKVVVTNQRFNKNAAAQADANQVEMVTRGQLQTWLQDHPVTNHSLDGALVEWLTPELT